MTDAPQWPTADRDYFVEQAAFGCDHWTTLAYLETRIVDHHGLIDHDRMRCDPRRHPIMAQAKTGWQGPAADGSRYPTRLRHGLELHNHDDYDCIDDLAAVGLIEVHMPRADDRGFVDAVGRVVHGLAGNQIEPGFVTGMNEMELAIRANVTLTGLGRQVCAALRAHRAVGGGWNSFTSTAMIEVSPR